MPQHPIVLESITFPQPVIEIAIEPKTRADQDKMAIALNKLAEEDPTFQLHTDIDSGQTIIAVWANCTWKSSLIACSASSR